MANLESDVMRSLLRIAEVAKNQAMTEVHSAAVQGKIFKEDQPTSVTLSEIDRLIKSGVDTGVRNGMREMMAILKPYIRKLQQAEIDKQK